MKSLMSQPMGQPNQQSQQMGMQQVPNNEQARMMVRQQLAQNPTLAQKFQQTMGQYPNASPWDVAYDLMRQRGIDPRNFGLPPRR